MKLTTKYYLRFVFFIALFFGVIQPSYAIKIGGVGVEKVVEKSAVGTIKVRAWGGAINTADGIRLNTGDLDIISDYMTRTGKTADDVAGEIPTSSVLDGKKWLGDRKIEQFLNTNPIIANLGSPPPGYQFVTQADGSKYIRRVSASDPYTPRLMVDEIGQIVKYIKPQRLASNGLLRSRLEAALGPIPANHQAHHLVSSIVAQNSALHQEAISRGLYDVDRVSNGKLLAETAEDFTDAAGNFVSDSHLFPTHFGSHPNYDVAINDAIANVLNTPRSWAPNGVDANNLSSLTPNQITELIDDVEFEAFGILEDWIPSKLN